MAATLRVVNVVARRALAPGTFVLVTDGGEQLAAAAPGQFVMLRPAWGTDPLLPRAFSLLRTSVVRGVACAEYLIKVAGRGTALMERLVPGDRVSVLGPLGRAFPESAVAASGDFLVAGGVGLAPLLAFAERTRRPHRLIYGARTARDLVLLDEVRQSGVRLLLATEDGSIPEGWSSNDVVHGRVTDALAQLLLTDGQAHASGARVLSCGPNAMMRAVAALAAEHALECLVSLEGEMACGVGVCLGCPVANAPASPPAATANPPAATANPPAATANAPAATANAPAATANAPAATARPYRYCCVDGPVFDATTIVFP